MTQILITVGLTASLTIIGNILYFEYKSRHEFERQVLKEKLTRLLLPLYFVLKEDDFILSAIINHPDGDPWEYDSAKFKRLLDKLRKIVSENLYLADGELHTACLDFLELAYAASDSDERFQMLMRNEEEDVAGKKLEGFKTIITAQYNQTRRLYLRSNQ